MGFLFAEFFCVITNIKEINDDIKNDFLYKYHIQGEDDSEIKLGAFYNNNLVAVMTFEKQKDEYKFISFATSKNIVDGINKLLNYFIENYNPKKIVSYADRRWIFSKNNLYENIGFVKVNDGMPDYWYVNHGQRFHRNFLNEKLEHFDETLTEWQNIKLNGYDRIWDCGYLKYEMVL